MDWLRDWDWDLAVEVQRKPLCWIVMVLFSMAGLISGAVIETLPRHVHLSIMHRLRPAESAVRRLIVMAMRAGMDDAPGGKWQRPERRKRSGKKAKRSEQSKDDSRAGEYVPAFPLFDPRKKIGPRRRNAPGYGPRIWVFDGTDDPVWTPTIPMPDDRVPARRLCLRLLALKAALDDLPGQAARLRRILKRIRRKWPTPMRVGRPPGHRARGKEPIDALLAECQEQAIWALFRLEPG